MSPLCNLFALKALTFNFLVLNLSATEKSQTKQQKEKAEIKISNTCVSVSCRCL